MHFTPVILNNLFSDEDREALLNLLSSNKHSNNWNDKHRSRVVKKFPELEYFSKKLEPIAREVFKDNTLKTSYSVYLRYDKPTSQLEMHRDNNACTYTIDYAISHKTPWAMTIEGEDFFIEPNQGLAFMGGYDSHGRKDMPDPENNVVEVIMFHFCPEDHWYFTEGPDYVYYLKDNDLLPHGEAYHLSPKYIEKTEKA